MEAQHQRNDCLEPTAPMITTLVFSGGGMKFLAYVGVLKALDEKKLIKNVKSISGTSAGSIFALLICMDYTWKELYDIMMNYNFTDMNDIDIEYFSDSYGLDSGNKIMKFVKYLIKKSPAKVGPNITFKELYMKSKKHLIITATCLNDYTIKIFDYINTPNLKVCNAIRMSISIPYYYTSKKYKNKIYIDGSILENLPISMFDPSENVLGFLLTDTKTVDVKINSLEEFTYNLFLCIRKNIGKPGPYNIIQINTKNIGMLDFEIDNYQKINLFNSGYVDTIKYFNNT